MADQIHEQCWTEESLSAFGIYITPELVADALKDYWHLFAEGRLGHNKVFVPLDREGCTEGALVGFVGDYSGVKSIHSNPSNARYKEPTSHIDVVLRNRFTGRRLFSVDGVAISERRTGWLALACLNLLLQGRSQINVFLFGAGKVAEAIILALNSGASGRIQRIAKYRQRVVLLFYTFKYASGEAFVDGVREASPATDWRETVAVMPVIFPQELPRLAKLLDLDDIAVDDLYAAGKAWIDSMLRQEARVVAIHIMSARVRPDQLGLSEDPVVIRAFNADYAAVRLANYVKEDPGVRGIRPFLKLSAATRCYDFSTELGNGERVEFGFDFMTGRAVRRELDERKHIRRGWGTPGNAAAIADWVISDRSEDDMALWEWRNQGIDRQVDHYCPHLDVIEHQSQNLSQP